MKKLAFLITSLPGLALAHGAHPEFAGASHDAFHGGILGAVVLIAAALILAWQKERGS